MRSAASRARATTFGSMQIQDSTGQAEPSPSVLAAWLVLGCVPWKHVPMYAAHWVVAGYDSPSLRTLAGEPTHDEAALGRLLHDTLAELAVVQPETVVDAAKVAGVDAGLFDDFVVASVQDADFAKALISLHAALLIDDYELAQLAVNELWGLDAAAMPPRWDTFITSMFAVTDDQWEGHLDKTKAVAGLRSLWASKPPLSTQR